MTGAGDKVFPGMQTANALKTLGRMNQNNDESSSKCHGSFMAAREHIKEAMQHRAKAGESLLSFAV